MFPPRTPILAGALALLLASCAAPRPITSRGEPRAARRLLASLQSSLARRSVADLQRLFTVDCRAGACRGFVPLPVGAEGRRIRARWTRRIDEGDLLTDLARALLSYRRVAVARLTPRRWRSYYGVALVRAELVLEGDDREGRRLEDRGLVDLTLRETPAGWRIERLVLADVERTVVLHAGELEALTAEAGGPGAASAPAGQPEEDGEPAQAPDEGASPDEGAASGDDGAGPASDGAASDGDGDGAGAGSLLPAGLVELTVRGAAGEQPLRRVAGARATLLLISPARCATCAATCRKMSSLVRARPRCAALTLRLGAGRAEAACGAALQPGAKLRAALENVRPLLPLLVLLDGEGRVVRMIAGAAIGAELEGELERRCKD